MAFSKEAMRVRRRSMDMFGGAVEKVEGGIAAEASNRDGC